MNVSKTRFSKAATIVSRLLRGHWQRYTVFAGTNTMSELWLAMAGLVGRVPLTDGRTIIQFERAFAETVGSKYAFSFGAGRMGLYALLEALDIGPGDEVLLPAFTCVVVPNALLYRGARPVYVDIDSRSFNIDVTRIEAQITPKTRAIIAQHTFGLVCEIESIRAIARRHRLIVIEDGAHALGAQGDGGRVGTLGDATFFSTDHSKMIGTGTGGVVTTNDPAIASSLAAIRATMPFPSAARVRLTLASFIAEVILLHPTLCGLGKYVYALLWYLGLRHAYYLDELRTTKPLEYPYPARFPNALAGIAVSQLSRLPENLAWRRDLARMFDAEVKAFGNEVASDLSNHACLRYTFTVTDRAAWQRLFDDHLDMNIWFTSVTEGRNHDFESIGYRPGSCPRAEWVAAHCVSLPTHQRVTNPGKLAALLRMAGRSPLSELQRAFSGPV